MCFANYQNQAGPEFGTYVADVKCAQTHQQWIDCFIDSSQVHLDKPYFLVGSVFVVF